jgi:phosphoglycolate phosphatase
LDRQCRENSGRSDHAAAGLLRPRLVVFDFDGTLADSLPWLTRALNDAARRHRFRQTGDTEHDALRRLGVGELLRYLGVPRWKIPRIARDLRSLMQRDIDSIRRFDGVEPMLQALAADGIRLGIVSSNAAENIARVLGPDCLALIGWLESGASLFGKQTLLKRVLRRAAVRPADAIYVGDEIRDVQAAHAAGMRAGAVTWGYNSPDVLRACAPELVFEHPRDVTAMLCGHPGAACGVRSGGDLA